MKKRKCENGGVGVNSAHYANYLVLVYEKLDKKNLEHSRGKLKNTRFSCVNHLRVICDLLEFKPDCDDEIIDLDLSKKYENVCFYFENVSTALNYDSSKSEHNGDFPFSVNKTLESQLKEVDKFR